MEEVADFLGVAGEMAIATQHKVRDKIDRMVERITTCESITTCEPITTCE